MKTILAHWKTSLAGMGALVGAVGYLPWIPPEHAQTLKALGMAVTGLGLVLAADAKPDAAEVIEAVRPSDPPGGRDGR